MSGTGGAEQTLRIGLSCLQAQPREMCRGLTCWLLGQERSLPFWSPGRAAGDNVHRWLIPTLRFTLASLELPLQQLCWLLLLEFCKLQFSREASLSLFPRGDSMPHALLLLIPLGSLWLLSGAATLDQAYPTVIPVHRWVLPLRDGGCRVWFAW